MERREYLAVGLHATPVSGLVRARIIAPPAAGSKANPCHQKLILQARHTIS